MATCTYKKIEHNVDRYSRTPAAGIVVLGSTGEAIMLSDQERRDVLKSAREAAAPDKVLIAGTGIESAVETLRLTEYAAELATMLPSSARRITTGSKCSRQTCWRFIAPSPTARRCPSSFTTFPGHGYDMPAELVIELADHPNIIGIKESSGDVEKVRKMVEGTRHITAKRHSDRNIRGRHAAHARPRIRQMAPTEGIWFPSARLVRSTAAKPSSSAVTVVGKMKTRQKEIGFQVLVGAAHRLHPSLDAGAVGAILAFACPAPTACYEIYTAWKEGDAELARLKQERIAAAAVACDGELGVPGREIWNGS